MKQKTFYAWAIDTRSEEGHGLIGRYWFEKTLPPSLEGCEVCLFRTRKVAREHLAKILEGWVSKDWHPKVVRVLVDVQDTFFY